MILLSRVKKNAERSLIQEFDNLFSQCDGAFKQSRTAKRAHDLAYGVLNCLGRHTLTGMLTASGQQFIDWSAAYRLFQGERMDTDVLFSTVRQNLIEGVLNNDESIYGHMDDTIIKKTGKKIPGTAWRRDPLGPPFHTNFIWGQRFIQLSLCLPENTGACISRAIPVDLHHCPTIKKPNKKESKDVWDDYKEKQKQAKLSQKGIERIKILRERLDQDKFGEKQLIISVDGSYTNTTVLKGIPDRVTLIGRIRKDCSLNKVPIENLKHVGRKRVYGDPLPTPEQIRQSQDYDWQEVQAWAAGKVHRFNVKLIKDVRWRKAGEQNLQLVIIRPLGYRLSKNSRILYRQPVYLICTDPNLAIDKLLQAYLWRWEIEVNIRDEKTLLGCGKAQVRSEKSVEKLPAFIVAIYAMILLAAHNASAGQKGNQLPCSKWYPNKKRRRQTTGDILNLFRSQVWAKSIGINFSHFVNLQKSIRSAKNVANPTLSAAFYPRN